MNKKIIISVVLAVALMGFWIYAQSEARKRVDDFVSDNELDDIISYKNVSYNPFTSRLELSGFAVHLTKNPVKSETLIVHDWEEDESGDIPTMLDIEIEGASGQFNELTHFGLPKQLVRDLLELGYGEIDGSLRLRYDLDLDEDVYGLSLKVKLKEMGEAELVAAVADIGGLVKQLQKNPKSAFMRGGEAIKDMAIADLQLSYQDYG